MGAHEPIRSELARGRPAPEEWARIDPTIYITAARQRQARAMAEAIGAGWRATRRGLVSATGLLRRCLLEPIAKRSQRRHALAALAAMDDRLLADIGLQRGDIELAVDGRLAHRRAAPRAPAPVASADHRRAGEPRPAAARTANANRPPAPVQPDRVPELAA
jgi:uncharacterized protein YjiS (DUF1127 family)